jgi:hypothetical protein
VLSSKESADPAEEDETRRLLEEEKEEEVEAAVGRGWLPFFWLLLLRQASCLECEVVRARWRGAKEEPSEGGGWCRSEEKRKRGTQKKDDCLP